MSKAQNDMYWCVCCKKFIQNKLITRQQHESSNSHKRNMQQYLQQQRQDEYEKKQEEMKTLNELNEMQNKALKQIEIDIQHDVLREKKIQQPSELKKELKQFEHLYQSNQLNKSNQSNQLKESKEIKESKELSKIEF